MLASGDLLQTASGGRVKSRLVFRFADGSVSDETAVFTQHGHFRLVSDHSIQRGPAFERSLDMTIDAGTGMVTVRYRKEGDEEKVEREHLTLPPDVANGMVPMLLKNVAPGAAPQTLSLVAATPKPRLVKLEVSVAGKDSLSIAGTPHTATHYVLKVDIGGLSGLSRRWSASSRPTRTSGFSTPTSRPSCDRSRRCSRGGRSGRPTW